MIEARIVEIEAKLAESGEGLVAAHQIFASYLWRLLRAALGRDRGGLGSHACRAGHSDFRDFRETLLDDKAVAKIHAEASAVGRLRDEIYKEVTAIEKASEARKVAKDAAGLEGKRKRRGSGVLPARMATPSDHKPAKNEIAEGVGRVVCQGGLPAGGSPDYGHSRQAIEMHEHGCSIEEIAEKLEYYPATVKGWIEATEREKEREKATVETN